MSVSNDSPGYKIVNLFEDEENFDRLRACRTEQEVLDLIDRTNAAA
ncbi:TPA: PTS ascorbate transporter subunit IIA [Escherichia coli]|nr:PTS ascorbate transporter subunit IIA [Escherichia coli]